MVKRKTVRISLNIFIAVIFYIGLLSLLIYFERDSSQSGITNYPNAIWFSLVTLTTVGYGDLYPVTIYGRAVGYIFVLFSVGFYGLLIGLFTNIMSTIKENRKLGYTGTSMTNHAVIIGWNEFGKAVVDQLVGVGKSVAVVTDKTGDIELIREKYRGKKVFTLFSDLENYELLKKVNIELSSIVFVNLAADTDKLVYILNLKKTFDGLQYVVTLDNSNLKHTFLSAGVHNVVSKLEISSKLLASYIFEPDVAEYSEDIMSFPGTEFDYDIKQFYVTKQNPYCNKQYQDVFFDLKKRYNSILIGISKRDKYGNRRLFKNPLGELKVEFGDYLIIIMNEKAFRLIQRVFKTEEGFIGRK